MNDKIAESTQTDSTPTEPLRTLRRRSILAGAAWSVPAVGVALATPAAAASAAPTGTIVANPDQYRGTQVGDRVAFPPLTGVVTISRGSLPARVFINFSDPSPRRVDLRRDAGRYATVDQSTGRFEITGIYNAIVGGDNPFGFVYVGVEEEDSGGANFGYATVELIG